MPYPTVKSSPYGRPKRRKNPGRHLWAAAWWKRLVEQAERDAVREISPACLELIAEFNRGYEPERSDRS